MQMGVIKEFEEYTPICNDCGINLCWSLNVYDYLEHKKYWDEWKCNECDPNYFNKWSKDKRAEHLLNIIDKNENM